MNDKLEELYVSTANEWRNAKGIGSIISSHPFNNEIFLLTVLQRIYNKNSNSNVLVITNDYNERTNIVEFITNQTDQDENNKEFKELISNKKLKLISYKLLQDNHFVMNGIINLVVIYNVEVIDDVIVEVLEKSKFKLALYNHFIDDEYRNLLYKYCPLLDKFKNNEANEIRLKTPVEETLVEVSLDYEDSKLLDFYNEFVSTSISIFGSLSNIDKARNGDKEANISSDSICRKIATDNGWSEDLDMQIQYNREIDKLFNPISLKERADSTYNIIRSRSDLLSCNKAKLERILKIVKDNLNKKILIINKKSIFATEVCEYINTKLDKIVCRPYHNQLRNITYTDILGRTILYKSGAKKGMPRVFGAQAQCTRYVEEFNLGDVSILSTNNSPDKKLAIDVDIVIITSPLCNTIEEYLYRLSNIVFGNNITLFTLYVKNSLEQRQISERNLPVQHKLINNIKNNIDYGKNNDIIIVD